MINLFKKWSARYFSDEEAVLLLILVFAGLMLVVYGGHILAPVIASLVFAYLIQGLVTRLSNFMPNRLAMALGFLVFSGSFFAVLFGLMPVIVRQLTAFFSELPAMMTQGQESLMLLPEKYPEVVTAEQLQHWIQQLRDRAGELGEQVLSYSITTVTNLITFLVYIILIPILVFFFLKDREKMVSWSTSFLPPHRPLMKRIWTEMNQQISNYVRGKAVEIVVVGIASWITFALMGLNYAVLLGLSVGLSVLIPYIGAAVVTVPVAMVAYFQWGIGSEFYWLIFAYGVIQAIDGNVLVPWIFSEAVNLHPVAIIVAVLVFGGMWGFWGVFFAIPLATLVKALMDAWPQQDEVIEFEFEKAAGQIADVE